MITLARVCVLVLKIQQRLTRKEPAAVKFLSSLDHRWSRNTASDQESTQPEAEYVFSPAKEEGNSQTSRNSIPSTNTSTYSKTPTYRKKRGRKIDPRDDLLITINNKLKESKDCERQKDRFDVCGENIAMKLRALPVDQRIMAEKLINDILFEAECNNLNRQWKLEPPSATASAPNGLQRIYNNNFTAIRHTELQQPQYDNHLPTYSASQFYQSFNTDDNNT